jgi:hypothetical protein
MERQEPTEPMEPMEPIPAGMLEWGTERNVFVIRKSLHSYSKEMSFVPDAEGHLKATMVLQFMELLGMGQSEIARELRNWRDEVRQSEG